MIRPAETRDIPYVLKLLEQVNDIHHRGRPDIFKKTTKYSPEKLKEIFQNEETPVFIWTDDKDKPFGYAFCKLLSNHGDRMLTDIRTLYIDDLCVDEHARGKHIGTDLFDFIKQFAKKSGCHNLTLNVWALNPNAVRFYEKNGMQVQKYCMETLL